MIAIAEAAKRLETVRLRPDRPLEREVLRVIAQIDGGASGNNVIEAVQQVLRWAQKRSGGQLPDHAWQGASFELLSGGRSTFGVRVESGSSLIWSIRGDDPDKTVPGRIWTTEVTIGTSSEDNCTFATRLLVNSAERHFDFVPHVPGLVRQVADEVGLLIDGVRANPDPLADRGSIPNLAEMLESSARRLPVVAIATDDRRGDAIYLDVPSLARALLGMAHVVVVETPETFALSAAFGRARSVYHGAVRLYYPGFDASSNPFEHKLFLGNVVRENPDEVSSEVRRMIARHSLRQGKLGQDILPFSTIRTAGAEAILKQRTQTPGLDTDPSESQSQEGEDVMDALRSENESLKEQAELNFELACAEEDRAKTAEAQLFSARARIAALESKASASGLSDDAIDNLPNTWSDVPAWCDEYLAGKLSLTPVARRGMRAPEYDDVERACRGLHWIAADFRQRRIDGGGSIANIPIGHDLENAPCGSDEFQFTHQGKTLVADWHIKSGGNTRDPARCLRIYFTFDPITQEAVVADMPAHRRTSAT